VPPLLAGGGPAIGSHTFASAWQGRRRRCLMLHLCGVQAALAVAILACQAAAVGAEGPLRGVCLEGSWQSRLELWALSLPAAMPLSSHLRMDRGAHGICQAYIP
jgi:hypothetical protein